MTDISCVLSGLTWLFGPAILLLLWRKRTGARVYPALIAFGLWHFRSGSAAFLQVFLYIGIVAMTWNVIDLLVMDWLIVCTIRPKIIVPPGTEHCAGWRDYGFHFKGFLHGCVYMSLFALVFAGIDYAILHFLVW